MQNVPKLIRRTAWIALTVGWAYFPAAAQTTPAVADGSAPLHAVAETNPQPPYTIGPGDILEISVWKEPDLSRRVTVLPDGRLSFPLIGEITAEGLTVEDLKSEIERRILRYVPNPNLTVAVQQINSLHIYVIGKVNSPGRFELNTNVNVLQALAMAGGLNPFASQKQIKIFRDTGSSTRIFDFNYQEVADGENLRQNLILQRGDVIVVP
jgi:polysaccharide export outer membrane protein